MSWIKKDDLSEFLRQKIESQNSCTSGYEISKNINKDDNRVNLNPCPLCGENVKINVEFNVYYSRSSEISIGYRIEAKCCTCKLSLKNENVCIHDMVADIEIEKEINKKINYLKKTWNNPITEDNENNDEIKNCPFCGGKAKTAERCVYGRERHWCEFTECKTCGANISNDFDYESSTTNKWNSRKNKK